MLIMQCCACANFRILERLMNGDRVALWIHGHTHDSFDYRHNGTRILCNPRGYVRDGADENPAFDPTLPVDPGNP